MSDNEVAQAIHELAGAIDRQTEYLGHRDKLNRGDWLKARNEDIARADRRREEDWERSVRTRAEERAETINMALALRTPRSG